MEAPEQQHLTDWSFCSQEPRCHQLQETPFKSLTYIKGPPLSQLFPLVLDSW